MVILSTLRQRLGHRAHHVGHVGEQLVHHRGLVPFLVRLGLHVHRLGFRLALLEDDGCFRFTLRADRGGAAFGFGRQAILLGGSHVLDALTFDLRRPSGQSQSVPSHGAESRLPAP